MHVLEVLGVWNPQGWFDQVASQHWGSTSTDSLMNIKLWTSLLAKQNSMCVHVFVYIIIYIIILTCRYCLAFSTTSNLVCEPTEFSVITSQIHIFLHNQLGNLKVIYLTPALNFVLWIHAALPSWTLIMACTGLTETC